MKIAVILCIKDGELFLSDQLNSIRLQKGVEIDLYVKNNLSVDNSSIILQRFIDENSHINVKVFKGDANHYANSFIDLALKVGINYNYYAFCDQDDIWLKNHLFTGIDLIRNYQDVPCLSCSRTFLINEKGENIGKSIFFKKSPSFRNALVQSIAGANTMVFNKKAFQLLSNLNTKKHIVSHDWIIYLLVSIFDGVIIYSQNPTVQYRQHSKNKIGSNKGFLNKLIRIKMTLKGEFNNYCKSNIEQLRDLKNISKEKKLVLRYFEKYIHGKSFLIRFLNLFKSGIYRQSFFGNIGLIINLMVKR